MLFEEDLRGITAFLPQALAKEEAFRVSHWRAPELSRYHVTEEERAEELKNAGGTPRPTVQDASGWGTRELPSADMNVVVLCASQLAEWTLLRAGDDGTGNPQLQSHSFVCPFQHARVPVQWTANVFVVPFRVLFASAALPGDPGREVEYQDHLQSLLESTFIDAVLVAHGDYPTYEVNRRRVPGPLNNCRPEQDDRAQCLGATADDVADICRDLLENAPWRENPLGWSPSESKHSRAFPLVSTVDLAEGWSSPWGSGEEEVALEYRNERTRGIVNPQPVEMRPLLHAGVALARELGRVGTLFQQEAARIFRATRPGTELRWRSDLGALSVFALGGCGVWQPHFQGPVCVAEERVLLFARPRSSDERPSEDCDLRMCVHLQAVLAAVPRRRPLCEHMPPVGDFPPGLVSWLSVPVPKEVQEAFREDLLMEDEEPYWRRGRIPGDEQALGRRRVLGPVAWEHQYESNVPAFQVVARWPSTESLQRVSVYVERYLLRAAGVWSTEEKGLVVEPEQAMATLLELRHVLHHVVGSVVGAWVQTHREETERLERSSKAERAYRARIQDAQWRPHTQRALQRWWDNGSAQNAVETCRPDGQPHRSPVMRSKMPQPEENRWVTGHTLENFLCAMRRAIRNGIVREWNSMASNGGIFMDWCELPRDEAR